ncbi:MAG: imidazolonepropionase-like amidohydrolase, partial [Maribacter sp.]
MKKSVVFTVLLVALIALTSWGQTTYIHCGKLIDGKSSQVMEKMTITIEGNKIIALAKGFTDVPDSATLIDLKDKTVLPGLMDMHVH